MGTKQNSISDMLKKTHKEEERLTRLYKEREEWYRKYYDYKTNFDPTTIIVPPPMPSVSSGMPMPNMGPVRTLTDPPAWDATITKEQTPAIAPEKLVSLIEQAAPFARRVLLWGPPGTGKSYLARTAGVKDANKVYPIVVHSDLPAAELRGHFIPTQEYDHSGRPIGNPILKWHDGPATQAWRDGGRLVLDEIDKAGDDALSFLLGVLDDEKTAKMVLGTTGEVITPHPDVTIWATMNGVPSDLPPALLDRFPVSVEITRPHPGAIAALPEDIQGIAAKMVIAEPSRRVGIRAFYAFAQLREHMKQDDAAYLCFGPDLWNDICQAVTLAGNADQR